MAKFDEQLSTQIKMISECFVRPKHETEASKQPYFLGPLELIFLPAHQIQKGLLFSTKPENIHSDLIETLKDSIAISLVHFYPLAGRFSIKELLDDNANWVFLDCTKGPDARLVHVTVDIRVSDIISSVDVHPIVRSFFDLGEKSINYDGHTRPLLSVQVTELIDGVFIGFTMNHSIVDVTSNCHYINSLSKIFLQLSKNRENDIVPWISKKPVFKPYFPQGWGPVLKLLKKNYANTQNNLRERIFYFSFDSVRKLKAKGNEECGVDNISSFQALFGFIWRSITRAINLDPQLDTYCGFITNTRPRFNPPLNKNYYGNLIARQQSVCKVGELLDKGVGQAAMLVHQVVVSLDDKKVRDIYEGLVKLLCEGPSAAGPIIRFYDTNLVVIGGSARFEMYTPEFGLGKAEAVLTGYSHKVDRKVTMSQGRQANGSVDLEVCLQPATMNALELDNDFMSFVTMGYATPNRHFLFHVQV
ncbi:uncharacterized protein LOC141617886 [Silene latifolia]|uniref:uncharacterized protein LOC141617886 n=1 Tax=Silene latifolia TaxID=37657 RepID=UPI003D787200